MNGILNINKPTGITSYGVIRLIKKVAEENKIGHAGTLDPLAKGILPLFLGKMTKLLPFFNLDHKTYRVVATFGAKSTTLDSEGELTPVPLPDSIDTEKIQAALHTFTGEIQQIPPMYSAVKINGKKLYQYARQGEEVERKPRSVRIFWIQNVHWASPELSFNVHCSKGTYVRTLVADVAESLGTAGYVKELTRTTFGRYFTLGNSINLDQIKNLNKSDLQKKLIDPQYLLPEWHLIRTESPEIEQHLRHGRPIQIPFDQIKLSEKGTACKMAMVKDHRHQLLAIGDLEFSQDSGCNFQPSRVFINFSAG